MYTKYYYNMLEVISGKKQSQAVDYVAIYIYIYNIIYIYIYTAVLQYQFQIKHNNNTAIR